MPTIYSDARSINYVVKIETQLKSQLNSCQIETSFNKKPDFKFKKLDKR